MGAQLGLEQGLWLLLPRPASDLIPEQPSPPPLTPPAREHSPLGKQTASSPCPTFNHPPSLARPLTWKNTQKEAVQLVPWGPGTERPRGEQAAFPLCWGVGVGQGLSLQGLSLSPPPPPSGKCSHRPKTRNASQPASANPAPN